MSAKSLDPIYRLHSQCRITDGPLRGIIIDLDRRKYETIPNGMFDMLRVLQVEYPIKWSSVTVSFAAEDQHTLDQYREWLLARDYIHEVLEGTESNWLPLPAGDEQPNRLQDGIIDLSKDGDYPLLPVIRQFEQAGCKSLQIRDFDGHRLADLRSTLAAMHRSIICNIHLFLCASVDAIALAAEFAAHAHLTVIVYHGCDQEQLNSIAELALPRVHGYAKCIADEGCCGRIVPDTFTVNHQFLSASGRANTCLDRKLSIDRFGNVKNCPSMKHVWGRATNLDIRAVLEDKGFRSVWAISKDQISICKVCEFRDICSDCRAYLSVPNDPYSKPAKCDYDPFTAIWRS